MIASKPGIWLRCPASAFRTVTSDHSKCRSPALKKMPDFGVQSPFAMRVAILRFRFDTFRQDAGLRNWLRHAFAVGTAESFSPTVAERELVERVAAEIARRGMTLPALVMLESSRPLGGLSGQALRFVEPWFAAITNAAGLKVLAELLERPGGMDFVVATLQAANDTREPVAGGDRA